MSTAIQYTYYGHSCFAVAVDGVRLLFDPFISGSPKAGAVDIAINHDAARATFAERGVKLLLPSIGETISL